MNDAQPVVEALGIYKSFGALEVLKGIDLRVEAQELVFIIFTKNQRFYSRSFNMSNMRKYDGF